MRYRATLAYDGTVYQGFQRQIAGTTTIQETVEQALLSITGQETTVIGAGRTDTGVHASGQVIAFDADWVHGDETLLRALNATLPDDIAVYELVALGTDLRFHPRFDALSRLYRYYIVRSATRQPLFRDKVWWLRSPLDVEAMQQAASLLIGQHDFAAFGTPPQGENTVRVVMRSAWTQEERPFGWLLVYEVEANAFLNHMVRRIVGLSVDVGRGDVTLTQFAEIFASADLLRVKTIAPPQGLVLEQVNYPGEENVADNKSPLPKKRFLF